MPITTFCAATLDDLLHDVFSALLTDGIAVTVSRGDTIELPAVALELTNPLARLSRSEARRVAFSCLGELCWYLSGSDDLRQIRYYLRQYDKEAVDGRLLGAYGPRLFGRPPCDQVDYVLGLLAKRPQSRRAVLQLFNSGDLRREQGDVPCTCTLQFLVRDGTLDLIAYMRSNDALVGLTHDAFCFTMLQELVARSLSLSLGHYYHFVGSLHFYTRSEQGPTRNRERIQQFLNEGFQPTQPVMPPMPVGDPWSAVHSLLAIEAAIREKRGMPHEHFDALSPYWQDLARLLEAFGARGPEGPKRIAIIRAALVHRVYTPYLTALIERRRAALGALGSTEDAGRADRLDTHDLFATTGEASRDQTPDED